MRFFGIPELEASSDCFFHPAGPLWERLELSLGKDPELRELSSFLCRPRSADQVPHQDHDDTADGDYLMRFFGMPELEASSAEDEAKGAEESSEEEAAEEE